MALASGTRLGVYEIAARIGEGGMGHVYRARDTRLNRDVAIKVLPDLVASDPDRLARLTREAQTLASLNHPHIAQIYGFEEDGGVRALVMELVEGPDLSLRIAPGAMRVDEALSIARQICLALEAAHEQGIVHRDLKPANIKVRPDGTVKVLDFGLAKALEPAPASGASLSPTITSPAMTQQGVILGTAAYMSPEQASGGHVDHRSDIWAFGAVLYEMLTGTPAFSGDSVARVLAKVLEREPDFDALPATTPRRIQRLVRRCLEKDPKKRIHHIADARLEIEDAAGDEHPAAAGAAGRTLGRRATMAVALGALALGAIGASGSWAYLASRTREPEPIVRSILATLPATELAEAGAAIAPDGRRVVYRTAGTLRLRSLDAMESLPLRGAEGGISPAFSPDGESIAFFVPSESVIKRVSLNGGPASIVTTTDSGAPRGLSWGPDDTIVFATALSDGLWRVRASGGEPERLTRVIPGEAIAHQWPSVLPNGRGVLFAAFRGASSRVGIVSLESREVTYPVAIGSFPRYAKTGHLVYLSGDLTGDELRAVRFDAARLTRTSDDAVTLIDGVRRDAGFDLADNGSLVYAPAAAAQPKTLVWVGRDGREEPLVLPPGYYGTVRVSPTGSRIVAHIQDPGRPAEIVVTDLERPGWNRISTPEQDGGDWFPKWTPDGRRIVFAVFGSGPPGLFLTAADGTGRVEPLLTIAESPFIDARGWTPDGQSLLFTYGNTAEPRIGLLTVPAAGSGTQSWKPLIERRGATVAGPLSPDAGWIVTEAGDLSTSSIYIERYPALGDRQLVSGEGGGRNAVWSGREIFYQRLSDSAMMAVTVQTTPTLALGTPRVVFANRGYTPIIASRAWDMAPNGRFLMIKEGQSPTTPEPGSLVLVQNWLEELARVAPRP